MQMASILAPEAEHRNGLSVRPDVLGISVVARVGETAPTKAIALLRSVAASLLARAEALHPGAEIVARRLDLHRHDTGKSAKGAFSDSQLLGVLLVPLDEAADFWARAELAARIEETLQGFVSELERSKSPVKVGYRQAVPRVRDTTPHRAELSKAWRSQLLALTEGAVGQVSLVGWDIPSEVRQHAVSLDEVRLWLVPVPEK